MNRFALLIAPLALLGVGAPTPARADNTDAIIAQSQETLQKIAQLIDGIEKRRAEAPQSGGASAETGDHLYTVVLRGSMCAGCAGALEKALQSVEGVTVATAPKQGAGRNGTTIAVLQGCSAEKLPALKAAVADAKTPHAAQVKPAVSLAFAGKLKSTATPQAVIRALRAASVRPSDSPEAIADALKKADLLEE